MEEHKGYVGCKEGEMRCIWASWKDSTVGNDTWISQGHLSIQLQGYTEKFRLTHQAHQGKEKEIK